jgi:RNA methyltransferase, TrmH family
MSIRVTSTQNPGVKFALSLQKSAVRKREGLFLIEGLREIRLAMQSGFIFDSLFICPDIFSENQALPLLEEFAGRAPVTEVSKEIFARIAYREESGGLLAIARQRKPAPDEIVFRRDPLVLVLEGIEKPGNLGAILRTADAAGVEAVLVCDGSTDIFNPNVVRSSLGALFTTQVVCVTSIEAIEWLKSRRIMIHTTSLAASVPYHAADYRQPSAIVCGAEATGVTRVWQDNSDTNIIIPMIGRVDSMNVSVATSIVLYEALRQRGFYGRV